MPQAPAQVEVHTVGVKHDYGDTEQPVGQRSVSQPPPDPTHRVHDPEWDRPPGEQTVVGDA